MSDLVDHLATAIDEWLASEEGSTYDIAEKLAAIATSIHSRPESEPK